MLRHVALVVVALMLAAPNARGQEDTGTLVERLNRLERDVNFVQKQVYRNGGAPSAGSGAMPANAGQLQMRISQIDEEIRQVRGLVEQTQFQNKQTAAQLKKLQDDIDFRLRAIEQKQAEASMAAPAAPATAPTIPADTLPPAALPPTTAVTGTGPATYQPDAPKPAVTPVPAAPGAIQKDFPDANTHYSYAFKLLNDKKFAEAATSFDAFVKKYPADPLTSNAFYWLGESQYARSDFTRSTESFRKGFEANPEGQKAPDNLYKLAMSLHQIKRTNEACIVLGQVINKYGDIAARTVTKATEARTTMQCKQ